MSVFVFGVQLNAQGFFFARKAGTVKSKRKFVWFRHSWNNSSLCMCNKLQRAARSDKTRDKIKHKKEVHFSCWLQLFLHIRRLVLTGCHRGITRIDGALSFRFDGRLDAKFEVVSFEPRCGSHKTGLSILKRRRCFFRIVIFSVLGGLDNSDSLFGMQHKSTTA